MFPLFPFLVGLMGSLHCLGMCGPLVVAYSLQPSPLQTGDSTPGSSNHEPHPDKQWPLSSLKLHLAFHLGRISTYTVLGALGGGLLQAASMSRFLGDARNPALLVCGTLLVLAGLYTLRLLPLPRFLQTLLTPTGAPFLIRLFHRLLRSPNARAKALLGLLTGLMPCCLSWAMVVTAAATQNTVQGILTMFSFGLGTVPALLLAGFSVSLTSVSPRVRLWGERGAGLAVGGLGLVLILQGTGILS